MQSLKEYKSLFSISLWVAGLGYFVELFDLSLFSVVRMTSVAEVSTAAASEYLKQGVWLYNLQLIGMMLGGVIWGVLADRKGRLFVMMGSILVYSVATFANAFIIDFNSYALCRFVAGIGLAGELGGAITLISETLPREKRGLGTSFVAGLGMFGVLSAALFGQLLPWRMSYAVGGLMGFALMFLRFKLSESDIFLNRSKSFEWHLVFRGKNLRTLCMCTLLGAPIYFTTGLLWSLAPELMAPRGLQVSAGTAILFGSLGMAMGDFISGLFSQYLQSRKKAMAIGLGLGWVLMGIYLLGPAVSESFAYAFCFLLGLSVGYWALLVTTVAELFGTNLRGLFTTSISNFVRGTAVLSGAVFLSLKSHGVAEAAFAVGSVCFVLAFGSLYKIRESFGQDLRFEE